MKAFVSSTRWLLTGLLIASLLLLSNGCQPMTDSLTLQAGQTENGGAVRAYIRSLGCPDSLIHDAGDHFIADGDMVFPKNMALPSQADMTDAREEQAYTNNHGLIWNYSIQKNIVIDVSPLQRFLNVSPGQGRRPFTQADINAFTNAVVNGAKLWNKATHTSGLTDSNIFFRVTKTPSSGVNVVKVGITTNFANAITYAAADYPKNGILGNRLIFNAYSAFVNRPWNQQAAIVAHELGHIVGLRHTNWQPNNESPALYLPGLPINDVSSIMNASYTGEYDKINGNDGQALRLLYPVYLKAYLSLDSVKNIVWIRRQTTFTPSKGVYVWYQVYRAGKVVATAPAIGVRMAGVGLGFDIPARTGITVTVKLRWQDMAGNYTPWSPFETLQQ
ncbi:hypothetical protein EQG79_30730 [Spirosoma sordidisoli]|uniref:Matrixin family metalloprotease n=3 Tax=Spirosoma TaxID=107 RepID=A0A4Q2UDE8_9BACT|nr:hypothetical protein EQG79_30730 [Spirosoma sordidisoli]